MPAKKKIAWLILIVCVYLLLSKGSGVNPFKPTQADTLAVVIVEDKITSRQSGAIADLRAHCDANKIRFFALDEKQEDENGNKVATKYMELAGEVKRPFAMGFAGDKMQWVVPLTDESEPIIERLK